ncbi:MAG: zinc ribbon domain-containing protein [Chlamydiota bacterium]|nr:zinc ribbon domain-containing protein [Chlamydiota bacterium]
MKKIIFLMFILCFIVTCAEAAYCPQCRYYNQEQAMYCTKCGSPMVPPQTSIQCQGCGYVNPYEGAYCVNCGAPIHQQNPNAYGPPHGYRQEQSGQSFNMDVFMNKRRRDHHREEQQAPVSQWRMVGTLVSTGKSKGSEVSGGGQITKVKFHCTSGSHAINTLVVREGANKTQVPITSRIAAGQDIVKDLPRQFNATGLRISHEGDGNIEVYVM